MMPDVREFNTLINLRLGSNPKDLPLHFRIVAQHGLTDRQARYHLTAGVIAISAIQSDNWTRKSFAKAVGCSGIMFAMYVEIGKEAQRLWEHFDILPGDLSPLYMLCRMPPQMFQDYLKAGAIHCGLSTIEIEEHPAGRSYFDEDDDDD